MYRIGEKADNGTQKDTRLLSGKGACESFPEAFMTTIPPAAPVTFWSQAGATRTDPRLTEPQADPARMAFAPEGRFYAGTLHLAATGTAVLQVVSPRPVRLWIGGALVLDESLCWRFYEREVRAAVVVPCQAGATALLVEVGDRSGWPPALDHEAPSRNRETVRQGLRERLPDRLQLQVAIAAGVAAPALSLRFLASQFHEEGVTWQEVVARPTPGFAGAPPSTGPWSPTDIAPDPLALRSAVLPGHAREFTTPAERQAGVRRFYLPVANPLEQPAPLRSAGAADTRVEPSREIVRTLALTVDGAAGSITLDFPAFESQGRLAPHRDYRALIWPSYADAQALLPAPILPTHLAWIRPLYDFTWSVLYKLVRTPRPESGLPNPYVATADKQFFHHQFVWDSSFTAICTGYGHRAFHPYATLDFLYTRQFDGGFIPRESDVRDGSPAAYEPDFSPNPPIMAIAEWAIAGLTGDLLRLAKVYPALKAHHLWLRANRRLPNGTYWTTGLANGLDNSPSLGDGYPDLTAQMAHHAEILAAIAGLLGYAEEAAAWEAERQAIGAAMNAVLWSEAQGIFSTSLPGGGHNPNKVVTAFWPLWTGLVPAARVEALGGHLKDPASFWRHHPIPSLAADSPHYQPDGNYWLGSTWAPTNYAAIKGFDRAGRHDLALETTLRHLECMREVFDRTGHIWENYCAERAERGNWSGPDYCWTALGPIALLFEVVIGLRADALHNTLHWRLPDEERIGVERLPVGPATVTAQSRRTAPGVFRLDLTTDHRLTLAVTVNGRTTTHECRPGQTTVEVRGGE